MREWWRGCVIYQIYPRSFQDSSGDGIGDLPGIIARLEHVADLGVDAIWLSPFFTSPMADMGYDVANYKDVDPLFGSLEDFDTLVDHAHRLGLKVIIDQVISHTSDQHPWFKESKVSLSNARADWYVWADPKPDGTPPNNWTSVFGGPAWEWNTSRRQYFLHHFLGSQPDLNFHNEDVQTELLDVLRFWLERGVDGFRFDTVNFYFHDQQLRDNPALVRTANRPEINPYEMQDQIHSKSRPENMAFLARIRALLDEFGATTSVGEVGDSQRAIELMAAYTEGSSRLHMAYSFELLGPEFTAKHFRNTIEQFYKGAPHGWPCWSFSNHDVERHVSRWAQNAISQSALAHQAIMLQLSLKGSVGIYQGEELGLPETEILFEELVDPPGIRFWPEYKGRDGCRTPMPWEKGKPPNGFSSATPWLPLKPPQSALNVEQQLLDPNSTLARYKQAIAFRKAHPALVSGEIDFFDTAEPVLAFRRTLGGKAIICVFNLSKNSLIVKLTVGNQLSMTPMFAGVEQDGGDLHMGANGFAIIDCQASDNASSAISFAGEKNENVKELISH